MIPLLCATRTARVRRKLYRLGDLRLPFPVSLPQVLAAVATFVLVWQVWRVFGVAFSGPTSVLFLAPPLAAGWAVDGEQIEGRLPHSWLASAIAYAASPSVVEGAP